MTIAQQKTIVVGLGELQISKEPSDVLTCLGLGSCIGMSAYDPVAKVGGMVHIVLPASEGRDTSSPGKFADTAVPALLGQLERLDVSARRLVIKIAGGAQMSLAKGGGELFKTGERNLEATKIVLSKHGIRIAATEVGGHTGRTLRLYVSSGDVSVTSAGTQTQYL